MTRDMRELDLTQLRRIVADEQHPLVFATVSGAHLYGFASVDSDVDLRGVHVTPLRDLVGLRTGPETVTRDWVDTGAEIDLVTHDVAKFCRLLLQRNGYVLEQLLSPLVVATSSVHDRLLALAPQLVTRNHGHHYLGFARTQWALFEKTHELKPLLYTFRVLLTGVHLMRTGEVVAHLPTLQEYVDAPRYLAQLVGIKALREHEGFDETGVGVERVRRDVAALTELLEAERGRSALPEGPSAFDELHQLVLDVRLGRA